MSQSISRKKGIDQRRLISPHLVRQGRRALVEEQDRGLLDDGARDGDLLLLAAAEREALLAEHQPMLASLHKSLWRVSPPAEAAEMVAAGDARL